ncbi:MAG: bifunctional 5,10-methylenetetrahydrofolate dehydrogenase/5,10-methenyltetrahydrofolate cyclohydrolase [Mycoplasma sp.]|nr:bifunctional 5,10-methylenetetrahydrofolate dehydrogenase/5,10-methenyltetrahydrofolate cyclohydrolase [Mycoplasma sp.]
MKILDGNSLSRKLRSDLSIEVAKIAVKSNRPHLCILRVGEDINSITYMKYKAKAATDIGLQYSEVILPEKISQEELIQKIIEINFNKSITGLVVQLPLPNHIDRNEILKAISPKKDVDGLTPANQKLLRNNEEGIKPCTPQGIITLLENYDIDVKGMNAVVLGRSIIVGEPMRIMLEEKGANVTVCHSQTKDISIHTKKADLIVSATGIKNLIKEDMVKDGVIIVDVGITKENGKIFGDVDFENVSKKASYITPNPGGVGPMTVTTLLKNVIELTSN